MDEDLEAMSREQLVAEVRRLEKQDPLPIVPDWPEFMRGCVRYRQSLDRQASQAPRSSQPYDK
jgi:hypothetical protein